MREPTRRPGVARETHTRAVREFNLGHVAASRRLLRRALDQLAAAGRDDDRLAAEIWISLALTEAEAGGLQRGMDALAEAQRRADLLGDPALFVRLRYQRGTIALRAGQLARAADELAAAAELIDHAQLPRDRYAIMLNNGVVRSLLGDLRASRRFFGNAVEEARCAGDRSQQFRALHNVGWVEFLAGDLPGALRTMQRADRIKVSVSRGVALLDRARVLTEAGLVDEADSALADALVALRRDRSGQDVGEVLLARAECALLAARPADAVELARSARGRFRRRGNDAWRYSADLVAARAELAAGRASAGLVMRLRAAAEGLGAAGLRTRAASAHLVAAEALLELGKLAEAGRSAAQATNTARSQPISLRLQRRYMAARLAAASGHSGTARRQIGAGLRELTAYQAGFGGIDLQTASAIHGRRLAELDRALAVETGDALRMLAAVERGRAVSSRLPSLEPPRDDTAARLLGELRQVVEDLRGVDADAPRRAGLRRQRARLERQIKARSWLLTGAGDAVQVARPAAIRAGLQDADVALASYARVGTQLHAVVLGAGRARLHSLGPVQPVDSLIRRVHADLDALSTRLLPGGLQAAARASLGRGLRALAECLLDPLQLPERALLISPVGLLATVPWGLLPPLRGVPVTVTPTASGWLAAPRAAPVAAAGVIALDGPDLARSQDELAGIARAWGTCARTAASAPGDALHRALGSGCVVHVAAHGTHHAQNPLFSSVRLFDGPVFAHELRRSAPHVVLSACELGLASIRPGDEALGLTSVLLRRGARCVVAGLARVRDDVAAAVMVDYHTRLAAGIDSAAALAEALAGCPADAPAPFGCFGATWQMGPDHTPS